MAQIDIYNPSKLNVSASADTNACMHEFKSNIATPTYLCTDVGLRRRVINKVVNKSMFTFELLHITRSDNLCLTICIVTADGRFMCIGCASKNPLDESDDSVGERIAFHDACSTAAMMYTNSVTSDKYISTREKLESAIWEEK